MKMNYKSLFVIVLFSCLGYSQVGVGTLTPNAALDINATDGGVLVPRVALTAKNVAAPVLNPQGGALVNGTLVWNTATAGTAPNNVVPGFYYWDTTVWVAFTGASSNNWTINGNTGTTAGTNFLGTTDPQDMRFKTNGADRFNINNATGQFSSYSLGTIGNPTYSWSSDLNTGVYSPGADVMGFVTGGTEKLRIPNANQVHAMNLGTAALPFYSFASDTDTGLYSAGVDMVNISTAGIERVRVEADGDVGIGATPNASAKLEVNSTNRGLLIPNVALTAKNVAAPITAPATSLLVYNTATAGVSPNNVIPGYYYWNGAAWVAFTGANSNDWSINGNSGTTAANYVGTSDNMSFKVSTVGAERMRFLTNGQVIVNNTGAPAAGDQFTVTTTGFGVNGYTTGVGAGGVWGQITGLAGAGVWGYGVGVGSDGVYGESTTALDSGVWGVNNNAAGNGVFGSSTGSGGYGVLAQANGANGNAVNASTTGTNGFGVYATATGTSGTGVYGETTQPARPGIFGRNNNATGYGIYGTSTGASALGVFGAVTGTSANGVYGQATGTTGTGVWGLNNAATGVGTYGTSTGANGFGVYGNTSGNSAFGVYGNNTGTGGFGVYGIASGVSGNGVYGRANGISGYGVQGYNSNAAGTGVLGGGNTVAIMYSPPTGGGGGFTGTNYGALGTATNAASGVGISGNGNGITTVTTIAGGAGGAFSGNRYGVQSFATITGAGNDGTDRAAYYGQYISGGTTSDNVYLGARIGGVNYKVFGTGGGSVSTTMETKVGERVLFAPEAPENWFFDIGEVQLVDGKAKVNLDPIFVDCISDSKPFKVFVQGGENTLGSIRITRNQQDKSFVVEDLGGASNGTVQFSIYAIWKNKAGIRFPEYQRPETIQTMMAATSAKPLNESASKPDPTREIKTPEITDPVRGQQLEIKKKQLPQKNLQNAQSDLEPK